MKRLCASKPGSPCAKSRRQHVRALGRFGTRTSRRWPPARTSTPFRTPAATTARSACWADWKRFARWRARVPAAAVDRTGDLHLRRADALRHRMPRQPADGGLLDAPAWQRAVDRSRRADRSTKFAQAARIHGSSVGGAPAAGPLFRLRRTAHRTGAAARTAATCRLGMVTAIAAPASLRIEIEGEGGHAGAVLMPERRDAFLAAAEIALAVEERREIHAAPSTPWAPAASAISFPARSTAFPAACAWRSTCATSMAPPRCRAARDRRRLRRDRAAARRDGASVKVLNADPPALCAPHVVDALEQRLQNARPRLSNS